MSRLYQKKQQMAPEPVPVTRTLVEKQLALAAGTERFQHRDPIEFLTETFRQTFDLMGQQRAAALWGQSPDRQESSGMSDPRDSLQSAGMPESASMDDAYRPRASGEQQGQLMRRFAEVSFQRGKLSAAVVQGQGKMMLFSCLRRTVGQSESRRERERMLFQSSSSHRMLPQQQGAVSIVNKGFADSAVGLVVDVLKNARLSLGALTQLAENGGPGAGTLQKQYPFLSDRREQALLEQYRSQLKQLSPGQSEERQVLLYAEEKVQVLIQKKEQMRRDFLQRLRYLTRCAAEAEAEFAQASFLQEARLQTEEAVPDVPGDGDGDGSSGADSGSGQSGGGPDGTDDSPRRQ